MNVTKEVINDLLPLYFSDECSDDTKQLVKEYMEANPDFKKQVNRFSEKPLPDSFVPQLANDVEIKSFRKARRLLKRRSYLMGFAIFFTLMPFSFLYVNGKFFMLLREAPVSALFYGMFGIVFWISYFVVRRKSSDL